MTSFVQAARRRAVPGLAELEGGVADGRSATVPLELGDREIWLSISAVRFDDGTVYAFRDLTDERALEAMRQDLVATGVSHELRTPLAAIYGAAMTLQRNDVALEEELRARLLQIVVEESDRLGNIVNDLLLSRASSTAGACTSRSRRATQRHSRKACSKPRVHTSRRSSS